MNTSIAVRPLVLDLGCCGPSALRIAAPGYDFVGFDGSGYDLDPEQANVLIVAGRISRPLVPLINALLERLARPRWVVAYGICTVSGAIFDTLPLGDVCPVDLCVPGCPPSTEALCQALAHLSGWRAR